MKSKTIATIILVLTTFLIPFSYALNINTVEDKYIADEGVNINDDAVVSNASYSNQTDYWGPYYYTLFADYPNWNTAYSWGQHLFEYATGTFEGVIKNREDQHGNNSNNLIFAIYGNGTSGTNMPHFWIQNGGPSQASGVSRSFMIVNENVDLQNTTNITSCVEYMNYANETLQIDCNTTTTGADLLVGDDAQFVDEVWTKDQEGEWHKTSRDNSILDFINDDIVLQEMNCSVFASGGTAYVNITNVDNTPENLVNLGTNTTTFEISNPYALTEGTATNPEYNYVYIDSAATIQTSTTEPSGDHAHLCTALIGPATGDTVVTYTVEDEQPNPYELIKKIYTRFWVDGAKYSSGIGQTVDTTNIATTAGVVYTALTPVDYSAKDTSGTTKLVWVNDPDGAYSEHTDFSTVSKYADGAAILANKFVNIVVWGAAENGDYLYFNVEDDSTGTAYTSAANCYTDEDERAVYSFPSDFSTTGFLILRTCIKYTGANDMQVNPSNGAYFLDLRGLPPLQSVAGSSGSTSLNLQDVMENGGTTTINYETTANISFTTGSLLFDNAAEQDYNVFFIYEDGNPLGEYLQWQDTLDRFYLSDSLYILGGLVTSQAISSGGDIKSLGDGDDFWLGASNQGDASVHINTTGAAKFANLTLTEDTDTIYFETGGKGWCIGNTSQCL